MPLILLLLHAQLLLVMILIVPLVSTNMLVLTLQLMLLTNVLGQMQHVLYQFVIRNIVICVPLL